MTESSFIELVIRVFSPMAEETWKELAVSFCYLFLVKSR